MGIDSLNKDTSGAALITNFKDVFPGKLDRLFIYRGTNIFTKQENIIAREDDVSNISLELLAEVKGIYGGGTYTTTTKTVSTEKRIKELARQVVPSDSFTLFNADLGTKVDLKSHDLYFTVGSPFNHVDNDEDQLEVLSASQITPNLLKKLISGINTLTAKQAGIIKDNKTISLQLTSAILDDSLSASKMRFVDGTTYAPIPAEEPDFEIESVTIESDQTLMLEFGNGVKVSGTIETSAKEIIETDIDVKSDKPLLPINVNPYASKGTLQFVIGNFNKFLYMPWFYAKKFLSSNRNIEGYITQGNAASFAKDLVTAVVDMFKLSHAFSTNFSEYRDDTGEIKDETIGGVALKALEEKDATKAVDAVLKNWEYKYPKSKKTEEYIRTLQILAASSEWISSSYCISNGLTGFHKSILDFYLDLESDINKDTGTINMNLGSLRYDFTYEKLPNGNNDLDKPIINLKNILDQSKVIIDETDRYVSLPELDDPISISTFVTFAGDVDSTKQDSLKYKVGIDITDPNKIADFFINQENSSGTVIKPTVPVDTNFAATNPIPQPNGSEQTTGLVPGQNIAGTLIEENTKNDNERIIAAASIPAGAFDITVISVGKKVTTKNQVKWYYKVKSGFSVGYIPNGSKNFETDLERIEGAVVQYSINTTTHGTKEKVFAYNKSSYNNMILNFSDAHKWARTFSVSDEYRDDKGVSIVKVKKLNRIYLSFLLGNYVDIIINWKHKDAQGNEITGSSPIPRIKLPSITDETRTKLGIRL